MKKGILWIWVVGIVATGVWFFFFREAHTDTSYEFSEIERGNLENLVSSTGTLEPVSSVDVGTQLSGVLDKVLVTYNDEVKSGQVLALLDTLQLGIKYRSALADLSSAQAQLDLSKRTFEDSKRLFEQSFISQLEHQSAETDLKIKEASVIKAKAALETAELNLYHYAVITSPINGTVINRNYEPGQTVAASLSAPVLFDIAEDLRKMEIQASVDESDIGMIKPGQKTRYTVEAYPDEEFYGTVRETRLEPTVESNVVNYTVIIDTENPDKRLLPGMTATIDFVVEEYTDVLLVSSAALRYQPDASVLKALMEKRKKERGSSPRGMRPDNGGERSDASSTDRGRLWYLNDAGELAMRVVTIIATDGTNTAVSSKRDELEGLKAITKERTSASTSKQTDPRMMMRMHL